MRTFATMLAVAALSASASAADSWVDTAEFEPFRVRAEFRLDGLQETLDELAELQSDVLATLELKSSQTPIELNLFNHRRAFVRHVEQRVPEGIDRKALYVKGNDAGRVYAYRSLGFETDLRHEVTHAVLHDALPYLPLWLDEGLAEYFEVAADRRASQSGHFRGVRLSRLVGWSPNLAALEENDELTDMGVGDYREAWAWVHFLLHDSPETRDVLLTYLHDIQEGDPPGPLSGRIAETIPSAHERLIEHIRRWEGRAWLSSAP